MLTLPIEVMGLIYNELDLPSRYVMGRVCKGIVVERVYLTKGLYMNACVRGYTNICKWLDARYKLDNYLLERSCKLGMYEMSEILITRNGCIPTATMITNALVKNNDKLYSVLVRHSHMKFGPYDMKRAIMMENAKMVDTLKLKGCKYGEREVLLANQIPNKKTRYAILQLITGVGATY